MEQEFSVAMCVYGGDDPVWFRTAVDSVLNQTVPPAELVLVVDGPVDGAIASEIGRVEAMACAKVVRFPENRGHGEARRESLRRCTHELVALMDADDISVPDRFERQLAAFASDPSIAVLGGNIEEFTGTPEHTVGLRRVPQTDCEIKDFLKRRCPFNQVSVMLRKPAYEEAGGYLDWYCDEDYYLWVRMLLKGAVFGNLDRVLVHVRVGEDMYRRRGGLAYFKSEARLQNYMLRHGVIGLGTYTVNVAKRLIVQVLLPNRLRGWVFQKFARE